jgi:hypothetical protein
MVAAHRGTITVSSQLGSGSKPESDSRDNKNRRSFVLMSDNGNPRSWFLMSQLLRPAKAPHLLARDGHHIKWMLPRALPFIARRQEALG